MTERLPKADEEDISLVKNDLDIMFQQMLSDPTITQIEVTPVSEDEWHYQPTHLVNKVPLFKDKILKRISIINLGIYQSVNLTFNDDTQGSFERLRNNPISLTAPFTEGSHYKVTVTKKLDIREDLNALLALREILQYSFKVREYDRIVKGLSDDS